MKKYEVTFENRTVDFRKALAGSNEYNEKYCNSWANLVYVATLPSGEKGIRSGANDECLDEIFYRAFNYCKRTLQMSSHHCAGLAQALKDRLLSYRPIL